MCPASDTAMSCSTVGGYRETASGGRARVHARLELARSPDATHEVDRARPSADRRCPAPVPARAPGAERRRASGPGSQRSMEASGSSSRCQRRSRYTPKLPGRGGPPRRRSPTGVRSSRACRGRRRRSGRRDRRSRGCTARISELGGREQDGGEPVVLLVAAPTRSVFGAPLAGRPATRSPSDDGRRRRRRPARRGRRSRTCSRPATAHTVWRTPSARGEVVERRRRHRRRARAGRAPRSRGRRAARARRGRSRARMWRVRSSSLSGRVVSCFRITSRS